MEYEKWVLKLSPGIVAKITVHPEGSGDDGVQVVLCLPEIPPGPPGAVELAKTIVAMLLKEALSPQPGEDPGFLPASLMIMAHASEECYRALLKVAVVVDAEADLMSDRVRESLMPCIGALAQQVRLSSFLFRTRMIGIGYRKREEIQKQLLESLDRVAQKMGMDRTPEGRRMDREIVSSGLDAVIAYLGQDLGSLLDYPLPEGAGGTIH